MNTVKYPVAISSTFLWIGFVAAISFMESWLKFQAPGITVSLGLGIGRVVFNALNKIEWILAIAILTTIIAPNGIKLHKHSLLFFAPMALLILQTFWLLPVLDMRAELHIQQQPIPPSRLHFLFVAFEVAKVACLTLFGITLFKRIKN